MSRQSNTKSHVGKTAKDKRSGAWARRFTNLLARADWQRNHKHHEGLKDFPWKTCNGKKNRALKISMGIA